MRENEAKPSKLTAREAKFISEIESNLDCNDNAVLQQTLLKLLEAYNKQLIRTQKVLASSDKQQERLIELNEKLESIRLEQTQNIGKLIDDKRTNAKNIIENKKKIFEIHKQELVKRQANIDDLTQMIIQKDEALAKLKAYVEENQRLRKELHKLELNSAKIVDENESFTIETLTTLTSSLSARFNLEFDILQAVNVLLAGDVDFSKIDHDFFSKHGLRLIQKNIQTLLNSYDKTMPNRELSIYIVTTYLDDILSVCADKLIDLIGGKNAKAANFVNFYDGQISVFPDGSRTQKPEIKSSDGTRWNVNAIYQVAFQYKNLMSKLKEKEEVVTKLSNAISKHNNMHSELSNKLDSLSNQDEATKAIHSLQLELASVEQELVNAPFEQKEEIEDKIQKLNGSIRTLRMHTFGGRNSGLSKIREIDEISSAQLEVDQDLDSLQNSHNIEKRRLENLLEALEPLELKHNIIVSALAKAMAQFELQQSDNKLF
jgi:DNA repair exonuclease SbcCD ATPase subunit